MMTHLEDASVVRCGLTPTELDGAFLCISPACGYDCTGCSSAISPQQMRDYAIRYAWLKPRLVAADFAYGPTDSPDPICAIVFEWPKNASIGADLDASIDAAMAGAA